MTLDLRDLGTLAERGRCGALDPAVVVEQVLAGIAAAPRPEAWLHVASRAALEARARELAALGDRRTVLPLFGVPFAVKDNIDVAGMPTTAGCPAYAYTPARHATVVARLLDAGAIVVGKTHMDQFATGLVGTRAPQGPCRNAHHPEYIAGGSSSGSAVVVAEGLVSFALGTDTAGSGRVPAALNGVVGLKPTRGLVSLRGIVPACASLDCVSVFAHDCGGAALVLRVAAGEDDEDPFSRPAAPGAGPRPAFRFGVPAATDLPELDDEGHALFTAAVTRLVAAGGLEVPIDFGPFRAVSALLYEGPWVAERQAAVGDFVAANPEAVDPVVRTIIDGASRLRARDAYEGLYALARLRRTIQPTWQGIDLLVVPTAPRAFRIAEVDAEPRRTNDLLGVCNNFVNLLDLAACVLPAGVRASGVPFGVTLCAPAFSEDFLLDVGARVIGEPAPPPVHEGERMLLAVVGAHLRGMPLEPEIRACGGRFERAIETSADYRLHALATSPPKPGLRRVRSGGVAIAAEVWSLPPEGFARFVAGIPRPLAIGRVTLADGSEVAGFVCEPEALLDAPDISHHRGWRAYLAQS